MEAEPRHTIHKVTWLSPQEEREQGKPKAKPVGEAPERELHRRARAKAASETTSVSRIATVRDVSGMQSFPAVLSPPPRASDQGPYLIDMIFMF